MKQATENIVDQNGFELLVDYEFDRTPEYEEEEGNPGTLVQGMVYTELKTVELIIAGRGINIVHQLHPSQREFILSKLSYED